MGFRTNITFFTVMVNGGPYSFLKASRDLRKSDPLFPLLFIILMKVLNKKLLRGTKLEFFKGLKVGEGKHTEKVAHFFMRL